MKLTLFKRTFIVAYLSGGMYLVAFGATPQQENQNNTFVSMSFRSFCQREPDPANMSYFAGILNENKKTYPEVRAAIAESCGRRAQAEACKSVQGLDLCEAQAVR